MHMAERSFDSKHIALEQLETALQLYFERESYLSVITLAGAAEEILGRLARSRGIDNSLEALKKAAGAIHQHLYGEQIESKSIAVRANYARNKLKHVGVTEETLVTLDEKQEAIDMLIRAIDNYWLVEQKLTPLMESFQGEQFDV